MSDNAVMIFPLDVAPPPASPANYGPVVVIVLLAVAVAVLLIVLLRSRRR